MLNVFDNSYWNWQVKVINNDRGESCIISSMNFFCSITLSWAKLSFHRKNGNRICVKVSRPISYKNLTVKYRRNKLVSFLLVVQLVNCQSTLIAWIVNSLHVHFVLSHTYQLGKGPSPYQLEPCSILCMIFPISTHTYRNRNVIASPWDILMNGGAVHGFLTVPVQLVVSSFPWVAVSSAVA